MPQAAKWKKKKSEGSEGDGRCCRSTTYLYVWIVQELVRFSKSNGEAGIVQLKKGSAAGEVGRFAGANNGGKQAATPTNDGRPLCSVPPSSAILAITE